MAAGGQNPAGGKWETHNLIGSPPTLCTCIIRKIELSIDGHILTKIIMWFVSGQVGSCVQLYRIMALIDILANPWNHARVFKAAM